MTKLSPEDAQLCQQLLVELRDDVRHRTEVSGDFTETCYLELVTEALEAAGVIEESFVCHYSQEYKRLQVTVSGYALEEERNCLTLFACVLRDEDEVVPCEGPVLVKAAQRAANLLVALDRGLEKQLSFFDREVEMLDRIKNSRAEMTTLRVIVFTDGVAGATNLSDIVVNQARVQVEIWDLLRLARLRQADRPREPIVVDCEKELGAPLPILEPPVFAEDCKVILAIIPGIALAQLYERYGQRLLEYNVRSFLQVTGNVNKGIRETLRTEPQRFLAYNNGISATADRFEVGTLPSGAKVIRSLVGLQIVNGGQTTATIHKVWKQDKADLSQVYVPCKLTVVEASNLTEMVARISKFANTQNTIQLADFSANEPYHIALERLSEQIWSPDQKTKWFYERTRGQYQVARNRAITPSEKKAFTARIPLNHKITKTDVAKIQSCFAGYPHVASKGAQKCFVDFVSRLRREQEADWVPDRDYYTDLVGKVLAFRECEAAARRTKVASYRAQTVNYAFALASAQGHPDFGQFWKNQKVDTKFRQLVEKLLPQVHTTLIETSRGKNVTEWCKKEDCWRELILRLSPSK